jgi:hypothetical protein
MDAAIHVVRLVQTREDGHRRVSQVHQDGIVRRAALVTDKVQVTAKVTCIVSRLVGRKC